MIRMAWRMAVRTTGSPMRPTTRAMAPAGAATSPGSRRTMRPVSIRPQVEAFTNSDWLSPRWLAQSPALSLSAIRRSAVSSSGMRSSASARHIRITPSCDDRSYWRRKASRPDLLAGAARTASTSRAAVRCTSAAVGFVEPRGPGERAHEAFLVGEEIAVHGAADGRLQIAASRYRNCGAASSPGAGSAMARAYLVP